MRGRCRPRQRLHALRIGRLYLSQLQLHHGYISVFELLAAEQAYQQARMTLAQDEANRFADTAALYQALGGGWWHNAGLNTP